MTTDGQVLEPRRLNKEGQSQKLDDVESVCVIPAKYELTRH